MRDTNRALVDAVPAASSPRVRKYASVHLDAVRGVAALAVVAYHIRYDFFLDYADVGVHTRFGQLFYVATSFGHDAVMVFFVLSGYLISGTILKDLDRHDWSWSRYLLHRLVRLYVVLIPGLLLTLFWDSRGMHLFPNHPAYTGAHQPWINDFFHVPDRLTAKIFFANLGFRQAISGIPPFGTSVQLWSLTYEFAYYLMFPAALLVLWPATRWPTRIACAVAAVALSYCFNSDILLRFPIWLFGLAVRVAPQTPALKRLSSTAMSACVMVLVMGGISLTHSAQAKALMGGSLMIADYIVGGLFTAGLYIWLHDSRAVSGGGYERAAAGAASVSYTLYVVHMSFLIFLRAWIIPGRPWTPSLQTAVVAALLFVAITAYATVLWYIAEARTERVREFVVKRAVGARVLASQNLP